MRWALNYLMLLAALVLLTAAPSIFNRVVGTPNSIIQGETLQLGRAGVQGVFRERPIVVLTFDDATESQYQTAWPLMKARQIPGTFCISTSLFDTDLSYCDDVGGAEGDGVLSSVPAAERPETRMTEAEAIQLIAEGADVQSHGDAELAPTGTDYETWANDLDDQWAWFETNAGYFPESYCVPGGGYDEDTMMWGSAWFQQVRSSSTGWDVPHGIHSYPHAGYRWFGGSMFPSSGIAATGDNLCDFIKEAIVPDDSAVFVLGFHCISDATETVAGGSLNAYPEDEFETFLDCLVELRDEGKIDVLDYGDAMARRRQHRSRWNLFANTGFAHPTADTDDASGWNVHDASTTFQANSADANRPEREVLITAQTVGNFPIMQRIHGLEVGQTYIIAADVTWVNADADGAASRGIYPVVRYYEGQGSLLNVVPPRFVRAANFSGDGTPDYRDIIYLEFTAAAANADIGFQTNGDATPTQQWELRYPRIFALDSITGEDTNSTTNAAPGLVTFSIREQFTSTSGGNADNSFDILGNVAAQTPIGRGPSHVLITMVDVDITSTTNYDWVLNGRSNQTGVVYCTQTGLAADDTNRTTCAYQDNDSNDANWSNQGGGDAGNQLHFRFTDNGAVSETVTVKIEGYVIR
jgi:peptidoglycan/xylan/chitin deacetylase (PgdA/CDA1 family)